MLMLKIPVLGGKHIFNWQLFFLHFYNSFIQLFYYMALHRSLPPLLAPTEPLDKLLDQRKDDLKLIYPLGSIQPGDNQMPAHTT